MTAAAPDILTLTRDARLAPYAMSAIPTWVWAADASRVIWANASGAAALGAPSVAALSERIFSAEEPLGADIARLAETLPPTAQKYERLRDIGSSLVCSCARVEIGGAPGILVIASETGRAALPLAERAARLFGASREPLAVFSADGALLYATGDLEPGTTLDDARRRCAHRAGDRGGPRERREQARDADARPARQRRQHRAARDAAGCS